MDLVHSTFDVWIVGDINRRSASAHKVGGVAIAIIIIVRVVMISFIFLVPMNIIIMFIMKKNKSRLDFLIFDKISHLKVMNILGYF